MNEDFRNGYIVGLLIALMVAVFVLLALGDVWSALAFAVVGLLAFIGEERYIGYVRLAP